MAQGRIVSKYDQFVATIYKQKVSCSIQWRIISTGSITLLFPVGRKQSRCWNEWFDVAVLPGKNCRVLTNKEVIWFLFSRAKSYSLDRSASLTGGRRCSPRDRREVKVECRGHASEVEVATERPAKR